MLMWLTLPIRHLLLPPPEPVAARPLLAPHHHLVPGAALAEYHVLEPRPYVAGCGHLGGQPLKGLLALVLEGRGGDVEQLEDAEDAPAAELGYPLGDRGLLEGLDEPEEAHEEVAGRLGAEGDAALGPGHLGAGAPGYRQGDRLRYRARLVRVDAALLRVPVVELGQRVHEDVEQGQVEGRDPGLGRRIRVARVRVVAAHEVAHRPDGLVLQDGVRYLEGVGEVEEHEAHEEVLLPELLAQLGEPRALPWHEGRDEGARAAGRGAGGGRRRARGVGRAEGQIQRDVVLVRADGAHEIDLEAEEAHGVRHLRNANNPDKLSYRRRSTVSRHRGRGRGEAHSVISVLTKPRHTKGGRPDSRHPK
jgi:hypothetical protein